MNESAADPLTAKLPAGFDVLADDETLAAEVAEALTRVEEDLLGSLASADELVNASARYLAQAGGKRVRPLLTVLTSMLGNGVDDRVRRAAAVMEMTHLATLYHDDVMDSAPVRRGAPAAHQVWGNSVAILTGDLILARASRLMSELGVEASEIQAQTFERLVMGQLHETVGPQAGEDAYAHYLRVIGDKTGSLVAAASRLGAHFGGCSAQTTAMLQNYGEAVGVAFQLADDVIDLTADPESSGKTPGTDLREGVATLPVLLLRQQAEDGSSPQSRQDAAALLAMIDADLSSDEALAQAVAAVVAHPVTEQSWQVAHSWAERAKQAIVELPESTVKSALVSFADAVVERDG
ncbi:polyprenyl synthetase family protein [Nesterenkonia sp. LB17]|uniref:polyprenyl synthetase family protein n=1 Tax=unclassified Nesterenkonia TaxID=2629769 RepID=UPI001F4D0146|nr:MULTISPECIES: polyprenyl synthetase family protein [unclassified Nesterenkonia]MCH8560601.1 polyprenyl synthetase family protein [Nesterenkonia sp. DZ6]MCH8562868.1 polyprenyl synthetase family protein [Nesterenkonia sp. YGD6]MCH8565917.1 polyprenyl synthetase family protein [Nesterenkonia sp. LB17]MCH8570709.1 polyprenyl synthetase family protein [Nesterenkonia sp. AY15]